MENMEVLKLAEYFSLITTMSIGYLIAIFAVALLTYLYSCFIYLHIGIKANLNDDWMAFVPVAREIYLLKITGRPWWQLFFLRSTLLTWGIGFLLVQVALWLSLWLVPLVFLYAACCIIFTVFWSNDYYRRFGYCPLLTIARFLPVFSITTIVVDTLIAFSNNDQAASVSKGVVITGVSGIYAGVPFDVGNGKEIVLGRDPTVSNVVFDQGCINVSRRHCSIRYDQDGDRFIVTDTSKNGTFTSDHQRLIADVSTPLPRGTIICLGDQKNTFRLG